MLAVPQIQNQHLDRYHSAVSEIDRIDREAHATNKEELREIQVRYVEISRKDARFLWRLVLLTALSSLGLAWFGLHKWHKEVQPRHDELLKLQIRKIRREIEG